VVEPFGRGRETVALLEDLQGWIIKRPHSLFGPGVGHPQDEEEGQAANFPQETPDMGPSPPLRGLTVPCLPHEKIPPYFIKPTPGKIFPDDPHILKENLIIANGVSVCK
jgi:hypothetical protein